jgi:hypothetical protein
VNNSKFKNDEGVESQFLLRLFTEIELDENDCKILHDHKDCLSHEDVFSRLSGGFLSDWNKIVDEADSNLKSSDQTRSSSYTDTQKNNSTQDDIETNAKTKAKRRVKQQNVKEACVVT